MTPPLVVRSSGIAWERRVSANLLGVASRIALVLGFGSSGLAIGLGTALIGLGAVGLMLSYGLGLTYTSEVGELEVRDGALAIQRRRRRTVVRRREIVSAYMVSREAAGRPERSVEIETRRGALVRARVADEPTARAVLDALGFGPGKRRVRISIERPTRRLLHPLIGVLAYSMGMVVGSLVVELLRPAVAAAELSIATLLFPAYTLCTALAYALLKRIFGPPRITVGDDGAAVRVRLRTHRLPRAELATVVAAAGEGPLVFRRRDGSALSVGTSLVDRARLEAVAQIATERLSAAEGGPPVRAASFERRGQDVTRWRARLEAAAAGGYREAGSSADDARAVLKSASATPEQRIGAALALRIAGEPAERVRVAAEATVDPRLREALAAIADDAADERVEAALRRIR